MKTIGLIGGMSWESTASYYRHINETVKQRLGGLHSARLVLYSVDFYEIEQLQRSGDWEKAGNRLAQAAKSLVTAGADFLVVCANTMHKVAPAIEAAVNIPLLHIADPTATAIKQAGYSKVGLLGTRFTMAEPFYVDRLVQHGLQAVVPNLEDQHKVDRIIFEQLCLGLFLPESRCEYQRIINQLAAQGAQAIVLGCTEIALLIQPEDSVLPLFDTAILHALAAADKALQ